MDHTAYHDFARRRAGAIALAGGVLAGLYAGAPFVEAGPVLCPLRGLFGLPCPTCGMTRALAALVHFDVRAALSHHALSPLVLAVLLATPLVCGVELRRKRSLMPRPLRESRLARGALAVTVAAFALHHALRVARWVDDGTLRRDYLQTSWTHAAQEALRAR